jgi:hypothetical protein
MKSMSASKSGLPFPIGTLGRNLYAKLLEICSCAGARGLESRYELRCHGSKTHLGCLDRGVRSCGVGGFCITDNTMRVLL